MAGWDGRLTKQKLHGHNDSYGCPAEGTKTEARGIKAEQRISHEIIELCQIIMDLGQFHREQRAWAVTFGVLFDMYTKISNKVVGILLRARKHKLLDFDGEMLFQRRDDDVIITLYNIPDALVEYARVKFHMDTGH